MKINVVPIAHPAWIFRGQWAHSPLQPIFLARALAVSRGEYHPPDTSTVPPNANLYPTLEDLHDFLTPMDTSYTVDIECAGSYLVCCGILRVVDEAYVCVRFRSQGGGVYDLPNLDARAHWLYDFLYAPELKKIFHNGQAFDIPYLERIGFKVEGYVDDTMLQAHLTYAELPKKLNFLALVYAGFENWKTLVKEEDEEKEG